MLTLSTPQVLGCTPCQCGVPGACLQERLPSFLQFIPSFVIDLFVTFATPFVFVLIPSLIARWSLKNLFKNTNATIVNTIAVIIGSSFVWRFIFSYFQPNVLAESLPLVASVASILIVYLGFAIVDIKNRKTRMLNSLVGALVILGLTSLVTFAVKYLMESQYNQIVTTKRTSVTSVLQQLGLQQEVDEVASLLKVKNYSGLGNYLNPDKKFNLYFRDYGGANFDKEEFLNVVTNNQLSEVNVYQKSRGFAITAEELLSVVSELLNSKYETDYYIDNHNYADENKSLSDYNEVDFLYELGGKRVTMTFNKDASSENWYLSKIGYFDMDYPGY